MASEPRRERSHPLPARPLSTLMGRSCCLREARPGNVGRECNSTSSRSVGSAMEKKNRQGGDKSKNQTLAGSEADCANGSYRSEQSYSLRNKNTLKR